MVMHARKLPRLNDGYFDRNQAHTYQNSSKFSKGNYNDRYSDKVRDSPSNGNAFGRTDSPDNRPSPRDRSYHNKSSYSQRIKEREREKDRERHNRDSSKSPNKEKSKSGNRDHQHASSSSSSHRSNTEINDSDHRSNSDRNSSSNNEEKERRLQVGDWSEHLSSSGKKYYYNCKTEVSQWEKPKEWIEWESRQGKGPNEPTRSSKERGHEKPSSSNIDKHSSDRNSRPSTSHHYHHSSSSSSSRLHDDRYHSKSGGPSSTSSASSTTSAATLPVLSSSARKHHRESGGSGEQHGCNSIAQGREEQLARTNERGDYSKHESSKQDADRGRVSCRKNSEDSQAQDMDISPSSTPPQIDMNRQGLQQQVSSCSSTQQTPPPVASLANLPKLLSQLAGNKSRPSMDRTELSAQEALQTIHKALLLTRQVSLAQSTSMQPDCSPYPSQKSPISFGGSALPTIPVSTDIHISEADRSQLSPGSEFSQGSSRLGSPSSSISSIHGIAASGTSSLASAALRPTAPTLTPSLANYFREDLIGHVMGWQADHAERQANKYSEEAHNLGSLNCTKVSAELKMARSLVRVAEIQATLQEQRILFLRQQIKELEEWKSQNSFMSDSLVSKT